MSNPTPLLRYDFTSTYKTNSGTVMLEDISNNGNNGTVGSGCSIKTDHMMGPCMKFDGTEAGMVTLPTLPGAGEADFTQGITLTAWISVQASSFNGPLILNLANSIGSLSFQLAINANFYSQFTKSSKPETIVANSPINKGEWYHLALTINARGNARLYKNGEQIGSKKKLHTLTSNSFTGNTIGGYVGAGGSSYFNGYMAWLSVYNSTLDIDDIQADMIAGEMNRAATFNKSLPVDFQLYSKGSKDDAPVIYIEQAGDGKDLDLVITNNSSSALDIPVVSGGIASKSNYHFQLNFRPGTLSKHTLDTISSDTNWSIVAGTGTGGLEYISFLCIKSVPGIDQNGGKLLFTIPKINANPSGGARNTNVSLHYNKIGKDKNITGQRLQSLSIVNHTGQKYIPLHVDVVGAPQVLNDGSSEDDLLFRIENIGTEPISLSTTDSATSQKSFFEVGVMVQPLGELMEWALVKQEDVASLALDWPVIGVVASSSLSGGTCTITLEEPLAAALASGSQIVIKPRVGVASTYTLSSIANAGQREIEITSTSSIDGGAIVTLSNDLGILQASTGTTLTLAQNTTLQLTTTSSVGLTISPPADVIAKAGSLSGSTLTLSEKYSLPAGREVYLVSPVGKAKAGIENATEVGLVTPHTGSLNSGSPLNIVTPIGGEHSAEAASLSGDGSRLTVKTPLTIPQDSDISQPQLLGTVQTATSDSNTLTLANAVTGITVPQGALVIIKPANDTVINVASTGGFTEGATTVNIATAETVQEGSVLSLAIATPPWQVIENSLVTSAISGLQQWTITNEQVAEIVSGGSIEFLLRDIVCDLPAGQSLVTIRYYNIPGYWDGKFVVPIQKGPVIYKGQNVGIGINTPFAPLHINSVGGPSAKGKMKYGLVISNATDGGAINIGTSDGGPGYIQSGFADSAKAPLALCLNPNGGKVGIGTIGPSTELDVNGGITTESLTASGTIQTTGEVSAGSVDAGAGTIQTTGEVAAGTLKTTGNVGIQEKVPTNGYLNIKYPDYDPGNNTSGTKNGIIIGDASHCDSNYAGLAISVSGSANPLPFAVINKSNKPKKQQVATIDNNGNFKGNGLTVSGPTLLGYGNAAMPGYGGPIGGLGVGWNHSSNALGEVDFYNTSGVTGKDAYHFYQMTAANKATLLVCITQTGNFGINTASPTYPLHVFGGSGLSYGEAGHYFATQPLMPGHQNSLNQIGAHIRNNVVSQGFYSTNTENEDVVLSSNDTDNQKDLKVLQKLKISDFRHKGGETTDNRVRKGLDGHELEKVLPGAVIHHSDFVRNIGALAKRIKPHKKKHQLTIHLEKNYKLKVGDTLELVTDRNQRLEKKIVAVPGPKEVVVGDWTEQTKKLFVYGKKVDDLRGIDYHQVAMLGISATQQLHKELEETKTENKALRKESKQLKKQFETEMGELRKELKSIRNLISIKK